MQRCNMRVDRRSRTQSTAELCMESPTSARDYTSLHGLRRSGGLEWWQSGAACPRDGASRGGFRRAHRPSVPAFVPHVACRIPHGICCMSYVVCVVRCILASSHVALSHGLLRRMVYVASSHVVYCMLHLARSVTRRVRTRVAHRTLSCAGRHGMGHCGCDGTWHVRVACADPATWQVSAARRGQR
jgi:hypothetical protein